MQLFQRTQKQNLIVSYLHFRKLHGCTLFFLFTIFLVQNKRNWPRCYSIRSGLLGTLSATISQIWARSPHPLHTMIQQSKIYNHSLQHLHIQTLRAATCCFTKVSSLCRSLRFNLCFGGQGGDAGSGTCTCASSGVQEVAFGQLLLLHVTKNGLFFGPKKTRKTRHANTGLFPPRMLFVLK